MEKYTFTKPEVHAALADFVLLKADVTANDDIDQALMKHFGIIGPPATLWFGLDGVEQRGLRLIGFENAPKFVDRVGKVRR
jgi:thiol:disulfide interchange protein DsbD